LLEYFYDRETKSEVVKAYDASAPAASRPADTFSCSSLAGANDEKHLRMSLRAKSQHAKSQHAKSQNAKSLWANGVTAIPHKEDLARAEARNTIAAALT
jgi:hypothetical protein